MGSRIVSCQRDGVDVSVGEGILEMDERSGRGGDPVACQRGADIDSEF